jgi:hypothetical protein
MRKPKGSISKAKSYKEIGEFWDTHDLTEFLGQTKKTSFEVDIESEVKFFREEKGSETVTNLNKRVTGNK